MKKTLASILRESATRMENSGVTVDIDSAYSTVAISARGEETLFMQGDEADSFISQVKDMSNRCPRLDFGKIELALAEPYVECLWS